MLKLDAIDKLIVDILQTNGRISSAEIAKRLPNVSERAVRYRINRLIDEKVIHIGAVVSPIALGYDVIADVFIEVEPGTVFDVAHDIIEYESVSYVACSTGERDISVQIVAHNNAELYQFVTDVIGKIPGVRRTTTSIAHVFLKDVYKWRIPND